MDFNTNILKSNTAKQIAGALAGMGIAALLYFAVDQASYLNIKGLLVSTNTVSKNAGQVNVNDVNTDPSTLRQLAARAATVAGQMQSSASAASSSQIAETPLSDNVADRRAKRIFQHEVASAFSSAPTYAGDPNLVMPVEQRVAIRAARIANLPAPAFAPQPLGVGEGSSSSAMAAVTPPVTVMTQAPAAPVDVRHTAAVNGHSGKLPSSGLGLNLLVLLSLLCTFFAAKTGLRERFVALFA